MGFRRKNQERRVECDFGEEQQGFRKGRGTADGMYVQRQMVENTLEVYGSMAPGFVDLGKAFDTVPRKKVMATLRWMGVPEPEVMMGNETSVYHNNIKVKIFYYSWSKSLELIKSQPKKFSFFRNFDLVSN